MIATQSENPTSIYKVDATTGNAISGPKQNVNPQPKSTAEQGLELSMQTINNSGSIADYTAKQPLTQGVVYATNTVLESFLRQRPSVYLGAGQSITDGFLMQCGKDSTARFAIFNENVL